MEGGRPSHLDTIRDVGIIQVLTSQRINQYTLSKRIPRNSPGPNVDVSIYSVNDGKDVLIKSIKRKWPEDKYLQLRRSFQTGNNLLLTGEQSIRREIDVLKSCRHPNIVQLLEVIDDPNCQRVFLVLEFMAGGEIQWRSELDEPILTVCQSRRIFRDVSLGLEYLHHLGIVHCDIKPANIVWSENQSIAKIIDMGIAYRERSEDKPPSAFRGTGFFMAPEVAWTPPDNSLSSPSIDTLSTAIDIHVSAKRPAVTKAIDVWSLAVTLYCFLFGKFPFQIPSDGNDSHYHTRYMLFREICTADWTVPEKMGADNVSVPTGGRCSNDPNEVIFLLNCMLRKDPNIRISIDGVKCHPWVIQDIPNARQWLDGTAPFSKPRSHWAKQASHRVLNFLPSLLSSCK